MNEKKGTEVLREIKKIYNNQINKSDSNKKSKFFNYIQKQKNENIQESNQHNTKKQDNTIIKIIDNVMIVRCLAIDFFRDMIMYSSAVSYSKFNLSNKDYIKSFSVFLEHFRVFWSKFRVIYNLKIATYFDSEINRMTIELNQVKQLSLTFWAVFSFLTNGSKLIYYLLLMRDYLDLLSKIVELDKKEKFNECYKDFSTSMYYFMNFYINLIADYGKIEVQSK